VCDLFARNHPQGWRLGGEKLALPKVLKGRFGLVSRIVIGRELFAPFADNFCK